MTPEPARFGRYLLHGVLGTGGFATVYRARDPELQREVALKALSPELAAIADDRERFLDEARALAALRHPNVVAVYDIGDERGRPYFTMELITGGTLADLLMASHTVPLQEALAIVEQLSAALDYIHAAGIVHRDVKDTNVMLEPRTGPTPRVVLMDFGVALTTGAPRRTEAGIGLGTPGYVAPEQIEGQEIGPAADMYALGVLVYQMLAGQLPFCGNTARILHAHAYEAPPPLGGVRPDLPAAVGALVAAALAKDPAARPVSAGAFAASLSAALSGPATTTDSAATDGVPPVRMYQGRGDSVLELPLTAGVHNFRLRHRVWGGRPFRLILRDAAGSNPDVLVTTTGPYIGTVWRRLVEAGTYRLEIRAGGEWTVAVG